MPKIPTKQSEKQGKTIADFFPRRTASKTQETQSSRLGSKLRGQSGQALRSTATEPSLTRVTTEVAETRVIRKAAKSIADPENLAPPIQLSPSRPATQALNSSAIQPSRKPYKERAPLKRKKKFESDSETDQRLESVVYIKSPHRSAPVSSRDQPLASNGPPAASRTGECVSAPHKRPRLSSPDRGTSSEVVPTSQPDEQEILEGRSNHCDLRAVRQSINRWRHGLSPEPSSSVIDRLPEPNDADQSAVRNDDSVALETVQPVSSSSSNFSIPVKSKELLIDASTAFQCSSPLTPPITSPALLSITSTPALLDPDSLAARKIREIKEQAYAAAALSSPESSMILDFNGTMASDSDDDLLNWEYDLESAQNAAVNCAKIAPSDTQIRNNHYNLRSRTTPRTSRTTVLSPVSPDSPSALSVKGKQRSVHSNSPTKGRGKTASDRCSNGLNPIDLLLVEKEKADKRGKGSEAFLRAEALVNDDNIHIDEDQVDWLSGAAALSAIRISDLSGSLPDAPGTSGSAQYTLDENDSRRLFGDKKGEQIKGILQGDLNNANALEKTAGVPLWADDANGYEDQMEVDIYLPSFSDDAGDEFVQLFRQALQRGDLTDASMCLDCGMLNPKACVNQCFLECICQLAINNQNEIISSSAFRALKRFWSSDEPLSIIPVSCFTSMLQKWGARADVLEAALGWGDQMHQVIHNPINRNKRQEALYRLIQLLKLMLSKQRSIIMSADDIADALIVLFLIVLDPSYPHNQHVNIILAVDDIIGGIAGGDDITADEESRICSRILKFVSPLAPVNQALVVSLLWGGAVRAQRIARWVAHSLITGIETVSAKQYTHLPSLLKLVTSLLPSSNTNTNTPTMFQINDTTDYIDMSYYVEILAIAISDVDAYVVKERDDAKKKRTAMQTPTSSPGKGHIEKHESPLQLAQMTIEDLHSRIVDTRAAHLDRSRAKAALKQLSMRIHYQRVAALKSNQSSKIQHYFGIKH